jgi:hypothetical protein
MQRILYKLDQLTFYTCIVHVKNMYFPVNILFEKKKKNKLVVTVDSLTYISLIMNLAIVFL